MKLKFNKTPTFCKTFCQAFLLCSIIFSKITASARLQYLIHKMQNVQIQHLNDLCK